MRLVAYYLGLILGRKVAFVALSGQQKLVSRPVLSADGLGVWWAAMVGAPGLRCRPIAVLGRGGGLTGGRHGPSVP